MKMPVRNMRSWLGMWFVLLAVFPLLLFAILVYQSEVANIKSTAEFKLTAVRDLKILFVEKWFDERIGDLTMLSQNIAFQSLAERYDREKHTRQDVVARNAMGFLRNIISNYQAYDAAFLIDGGSGRIVMSTMDHMEGRIFQMKGFLAKVSGSSEVEFSDFHYDPLISKHEHFHVAVNIPLPDGTQRRNSSLVLLLNIDLDASLYPMLSDRTGLGESGETFILRTDGMALSRLRWQQNAPLRYRIQARPAQQALTGETGFVIADDYRGTRVAAAYSWLPRLQWGFVAKQDYEELTAPLRKQMFTTMLWILAAMALVVTVGLVIAHGLASPLRSMARMANRVADGDMDIRLPSSRISELNTLAKAFNGMVDTVDTELRSGRKSAAVTSGLVTHGSTQELAEQVCRDLARVCDAMIGVFYLNDEHSRLLNPIAAVGIPYTELPALNARHPSGTLAHALLAEDAHFIHGLDNPEIRFETVAGVARPSEIATLPFFVDGRVLGAVILARATAFTKSDIRTIRSVLPELGFALERMIRDEERERLSRAVQENNQELE
ncbi:MAG: HAMP domain-containing protein, partial [Bacteroidetes bacterium]|nr:HAMP domain-containing protein [Bacteroidota bacterium]